MPVECSTVKRAGRPRDVRLDAAIVRAIIDLKAEAGLGDLNVAAIARRSPGSGG
jgi:hypothetical protein